MTVRSSIKAGIALLGCVFGSATANAQNDPGSLERTRPQLEAGQVTRAPPKFTAPTAPAPSEAGIAQTFVLSAVVIEGATVFSSEELAKSFEPYLASLVGQAELDKIAQAITQQYRDVGYLLSYATVPEQSVQSGIVRIKVVEGYVAKVRLAGDVRTATAVQDIFQRVAADRPLRIASLERVIGLGRDVPGVIISDVQISRSDEDRAQHTLTVVLGKDRFRALAYVDNRGTVVDARMRGYASFSAASLAFPGDQLQVDLFGIPYDKFRYAYGHVKWSAPVGADGLRLAGYASYGDSFERVTGPDQDGMSRQFIAEASYPFIKSRALSLVGYAQLGDLKSELERLDIVVQRDRIQVARLWFDLTRVTSTRLDFRVGISRGLDLGPATDSGDIRASRPASSKFTKFNASLQATTALTDQARLRFDSVAQISTGPLLAPEEFALGGSRIGRAFDFNEITGDHGVAGMIELAYRLDGIVKSPNTVELFASADGGGAFRDRASFGLPKEQWLAGLGAGARLSAFGMLWSAEVGVPIALSNGDRGARAFFSATKVF